MILGGERMSKDERLGWIGLNMVPGLGPRRIRRLVDCLQGAQEAWQAPEHLLAEALGIRLARNSPPSIAGPGEGIGEGP